MPAGGSGSRTRCPLTRRRPSQSFGAAARTWGRAHDALPTLGDPTAARECHSQRSGRAARRTRPSRAPVHDRAVHEHNLDGRRVVLAGRARDPRDEQPVGRVQRVRDPRGRREAAGAHPLDDGRHLHRGYLPHDRRVLYRQGAGGNENDHLYLLDTTGTARDLTPGDSLKAVFVDWTGDDSSFYYATNGRDRRFFDVYEMPVATLTPRGVLRYMVGYQVAAISSDRPWSGLQRPLTTQNSEMYLRDMQTGEVRHVSPHAGDVQYNPQAFSPDGKYLYYTTDEGSEFAWLARYDLATGRPDTVQRPSWDGAF